MIEIKENNFSEQMRKKVLDKKNNKILIAKISGSNQETDLTVPPNCNGYGRIRHFRINKSDKWIKDPLPNVPYAYKMSKEIENVLKTQIFQISACDFRCWFCFVDLNRLSGNQKYAKYFTTDELIELYIKEENRPQIIDLSGGQPNLVPEWTYWMMKSIEKYSLNNVYLWQDDNLSNYFYWKYLNDRKRKYIAEFSNFGKVSCFKGIDANSFSFNTNTNPNGYQLQFEIFKKYFEEGIDLYAYVIFTAEPFSGVKKTIKTFIDNLQKIHHNLPLRTVPLEIEIFSPTSKRINILNNKAIEFQYIVLQEWMEELHKRYSMSELNLPISEIQMNFYGK